MGNAENQQALDPLAALEGGGAMGRRIRKFDWSATSLGPIDRWPQSLRSALSICLNSNFPIAIYWGSDLLLLYNDEWSPIPGEKHPGVLGRPAREAWPEIWHIIEPLFERVMTTGEATRSRDQLLPMHRHGFTEECYFDYTFSPIRGDGGKVEGVFNAVLETTTRVIGERRLRTLRELGAWKTGDARTAEEACQAASRILAENPHDVPFALLYLLDSEEQQARLVSSTGVARELDASLAVVGLNAADPPWPFQRVMETGQPVDMQELPVELRQLPGGAWPEPPHQAVVLPMAKSGQTRPAGFIVAGISPRLALDNDYRGFLDLLANHIAAAVASARAYAEERRRAEALAELDRAKTAFFSNVSHEFRTPLTLMLGPIEDLLAMPADEVPPAYREPLRVVHRNGLRLHRLVNTLLEFSRIEAGRVRAYFEPTDLAAFTAELASNFRSACERAGLDLRVECPPLSEPVYVDRQMWEKVVLNLLSNAFKFTFEGRIAVSVHQRAKIAELQVSDTGTGIAAEEMPRLFERFHRIESARGRTHEGSGIGLALVQELVKLHGGSITAESAIGQGTTFTVTIPLGASHLPPEQVGTDQTLAVATPGADPFVEEALRWLPDAENEPAGRNGVTEDVLSLPPISPAHGLRPLILVVDDNHDMRQYLVRLLAGEYRVEAAADGEAALAAVRRAAPDLVVSDVMMPRLDGFGLLRELRADPHTAGIPVILLSARAGEESRVEGMQVGADDYVVKPFSARELLARVSAHLQMARLRKEATRSLRASEERFQLFMDHSPTTAYIKDAQGRYHFVNRTVERMFNRPLEQWVGKTDFDIFPPHEAKIIHENDLSVLASGQTAQFLEASTAPDGVHHYLSFKFPLRNGDGSWLLAGMSADITEQQRAFQTQQQLAAIVESSHDAIMSIDLNGTITSWNRGAEKLYGYLAKEIIGKPVSVLIPPDRTEAFPAMLERFRRGERIEHFETVRVAKDGRRVDVLLSVSPVLDAEGKVTGASKIAHDITDRKKAEIALRQSEMRERLRANELATLLEAVPAVVWIAHDRECRRITGNRAASKLLRLPMDANQSVTAPVPERPAHFKVLQDGVELRPDQLPVQMAAATGQEVRDFEEEVVFDDGQRVHLLGQAMPLRDELGQVRGAVASFIDITERKQAEQERERLLEELRDQDKRKDEFLATLAHELRNPLAPLRNGLEVLRLGGLNTEVAEEVRSMMERQLEQMVHLIDDLLDLSRISRGKIELRNKRIEVTTIVQAALEASRPAIDEACHELKISAPSEPIYVDADVTRLGQVISNLLNNAAKYTERGGRIYLAVEPSDREVMIRVKDNGIGIPAHMLPHVFDMFTQVDRSLERSQGGLGIGLSIVKRLVEMHDGRVHARSDGPGMGSEFIVCLPRATSAMPRQGGDAEPACASGRRKILVVDDNRDAATSLAMMLKLMGNDTRTAHDGLEALDVAAMYHPDLILLDIGMPRLNGYETAKRIRDQAWGQNIRLVALTGWGQDNDRRKSEEVGFDEHMVKPISPESLKKLLASL